MKRFSLTMIFGFLVLVEGFSIDAAASVPLFEDLADLCFLDIDALADFDGDDLCLFVKRDTQKMTVVNTKMYSGVTTEPDRLQEYYTVDVTTKIVRKDDIAKGIDANAMMNPEWGVPVEVNGVDTKCNPVQLPSDTYELDYLQDDVAGCGPGIHIKASVETPLVGGGSYNAEDFFFHEVKDGGTITGGCVGALTKKDTTKVIESYKKSSGDRNITIDSYSEPPKEKESEAKPARETSSKKAKKSKSKPWWKVW